MIQYLVKLALPLLLAMSAIAACAQTDLPVYAFSFGSKGTNDGQFNWPIGLAVDSNGNLYVADEYNDRIQEFDSNGNYLNQWGTLGTNSGQFDRPYDLVIENTNVFVSDTFNHRIQKFSTDGTFLTQWGSQGSAAGQFRQPHGIAVNTAGNVFVADKVNDRVEEFTGDGTYLAQFGSSGTNAGQLNSPRGLAIDANDHIYVADQNNFRVVKFAGDGTYLTEWGNHGTNAGQFGGTNVGPNGVAVDKSGNVWVVDQGNSNIQAFTPSGNYLAQFGMPGTNSSQFISPVRLLFDPTGTRLYVADLGNNRIQVFNYVYPPPTLQITSAANGNINFAWPALIGQNYQLQSSTNLNSTNWNVLMSVVATNYSITASNFVSPGPQQFYRLALVP